MSINFFNYGVGVRLSPLGTWATIWPTVPAPAEWKLTGETEVLREKLL
jgi:hypothetical protein